jgi:hypothetical protein
MIPPVLRLTTVTGAWLSRRAKAMAAKLLKRNSWSDVEVVDGFIIRANRAAGKATATVLDPAGLVVVNPAGSHLGEDQYRLVEPRDGYNSRVKTSTADFSLPTMRSVFLPDSYYAFGFSVERTNPPAPPNNWYLSVPLPDKGWQYVKRGRVRAGGLLRYPMLSDQLPFPVDTDVFTGVQTHGSGTAGTPGYWWSGERIVELTSGFAPARIASMFPLEFTYIGDAPVAASKGLVSLVVMPVVRNDTSELPAAATDWGVSAVYMTLLQADPNRGPATVLWSRLWSPDEHSVTFFHNGIWEAFPDLPQYDLLVPPKPPTVAAWDTWWESNTTGGARPNWADCLSVVWFNDRFIVNVRLAAFNGVYNPPVGETPHTYRMAGGSAHIRFEVLLDGTLTVDEISHEVWNAPEQYNAPSYTGLAPYDVWVFGQLPDAIATSSMPVASLSTDTWLFEATAEFDVDRRNPEAISAASGAWRWMYPTNTATDRLVYKITRLDEDGSPLPPETRTVVFSEIGCGVDLRRIITRGANTFRVPPIHYGLRTCDSQFAVVGENEVAFLARETWFDFSFSNTLKFVVIDLLTGAVDVRSDTGASSVWADDHMMCPHLDCIQVATPDGLQGVYMVTSQPTMKSRISRDSGATWDDYIVDHTPGVSTTVAAYYVGNAFGGGSKAGHAVE